MGSRSRDKEIPPPRSTGLTGLLQRSPSASGVDLAQGYGSGRVVVISPRVKPAVAVTLHRPGPSWIHGAERTQLCALKASRTPHSLLADWKQLQEFVMTISTSAPSSSLPGHWDQLC